MEKDFEEKFNNWNTKKQEIEFSGRTKEMYFKVLLELSSNHHPTEARIEGTNPKSN